MEIRSFLKYLLLSILASVGLYFMLNAVLDIWKYRELLAFSILFYIAITAALYVLGKVTVKLNNSNIFLGLVVGSVLFKIIASIIFIGLYTNSNQPEDKLFMIPFLLVYLCFTIGETLMLSRIARKAK